MPRTIIKKALFSREPEAVEAASRGTMPCCSLLLLESGEDRLAVKGADASTPADCSAF